MKKYSLTEEHRSQLKPWADKWIANAMSTEAMTDDDKKICAAAVARLYASAKLPPPKRIVFVASPFVLRFASGFAAHHWYAATRDATYDATYAATRAATSVATSVATYAATDDATSVATDAATYAATSVATHAATDDATAVATRAATDDATSVATDAATYAATYAATHAATDAATDAATHAATRAATDDATDQNDWYLTGGNPASGRTKSEIEWAQVRAYSLWQGGNQWSAWDSFLSFFRHIAKLDLQEYKQWEAWETLSLHSGPRCVHREFCMISDRPCVLKVDEQNRPHCEDGPFCAWRDGSMLFAVHGVRVPAWIILHPELITVQKIQAQENAEIRRVMLDKFGAERYVREGGFKPIHKDDFGTLWQVIVPGDEAITMVEVVNSTPEQDGSFKNYWIRVAPDLRPMLDGNKYGDPQAMTACNAVASTFGLRGEEYLIQAES